MSVSTWVGRHINNNLVLINFMLVILIQTINVNAKQIKHPIPAIR